MEVGRGVRRRADPVLTRRVLVIDDAQQKFQRVGLSVLLGLGDQLARAPVARTARTAAARLPPLP